MCRCRNWSQKCWLSTFVFKSYVTRVGVSPLEDELNKKESKKRGWAEYGSVTGRVSIIRVKLKFITNMWNFIIYLILMT